MGERLGFPGIKLSITIDLITGKSFLEYYLDYLKSFSLLSKQKMQLMIMTSAQNDAQTKEFIQMRNINQRYSDYVEMSFIVQDLPMPSIKNSQGDFQFQYDNKNNLVIEGKPHGHGDVHLLIKQSNILDDWRKKGVKAVLFFQDTNPLSLPNTPALYGIFAQKQFKFMFSSIKRKKGEAIGVLVEDSHGKVFNMEYNIFEKLPISKSEKEFAGNVNLFVIDLEEYQRILSKENGGLTQEFINVKKDPITGEVLKTFRLECLMQDISKDIEGKIGVVEQDRSFNFTTTKNNLETGKHCQQKGIKTETILECENDVYVRNCRLLSYLNIHFEQGSYLIS
jgi:UDP-N-acetylglucosamine pyrophosphorylase